MRETIRVELSVAGPCPTLRRVLTAARQWEILAEELLPDGGARLGRTPGRRCWRRWPATGPAPETIRDDGISADVRGRLNRITDVAGNVVVYCSQLQSGGRYFGEPGHPSLLGRATDKAIDWAGRFAVGRITRR